MKTRIFLLVVLMPMFVFSQKEIQRPDYPSYRTVMTRFLTDYDIFDLKYPEEFRLTKKPDGWHAAIWDYEKDDFSKDELYWSRKESKFLSLSFKVATEKEITPDEQAVIDDNMNNAYDKMLPYDFYRGWYKDVINDFGNEKNLSDTMLNALARAYAQQASNLLSDQYALAVKSEIYSLAEGQNVLNEEQLKTYRQWHEKALETYLILKKKNPGFSTFIGDVNNIYSNEVMSSYLLLSYFANEEEARKELKPGLYDDFMLKSARNYLLSCDSNAILFTNGDNDTYPLLYVQAFENFRTDVTVINISLLAVRRYISSLFIVPANRQPVNFAIPQSYWNNSSNDYYYVSSESDTMNATEALAQCVLEDMLDRNRGYGIYPTRHTVIKWNAEDSISIFPRENYIFLNQLAILDIVASNIPERPVYFSSSTATPIIPADFLLADGLAYKLVPYQTNDPRTNFYSGGVEPMTVLRKFRDVFQIPDLSLIKTGYSHYNLFANIYRVPMCQAMIGFANLQDTLHALEILDLCESYFPYSVFPAGSYTIPVVQILYQLGKTERADQLSYIIMTGIEADYPVEASSKQDLQYALSMLNYMENLIRLNSQDQKLVQQAKTMAEHYKSETE